MLDCFQGLGGVSEGFLAEGFTVHGIEINPKIAKICFDTLNAKYPGKITVQVADMATLRGEDFRGYDVIWGSPPCRDFSRMCTTSRKYWRGKWVEWKDPPNPERGLELVNAFLKFKDEANPKMWIMENVPGLANHVSKPTQISYIGKTMKRAFWGNFPHFLMPLQSNTVNKSAIRDPWERAKIPLACSRAFAVACRQQLEEVKV